MQITQTLQIEDYAGLKDIMQLDTKKEVYAYTQWNSVYFNSDENELMIRDNTKEPAKMDSVTLANIYLNHKHYGIGTKIIDWLETYAKSQNAKICIIESILSTPMRNLALKKGYTQDPINKLNYIKKLSYNETTL